MFAYALAPIDFWAGWLSEDEFKNHLPQRYSADDAANAWSAYEAFRNQAYERARQGGWEGDIRAGPFIAGLPTADPGVDGQIMIAWKQGNNGTTFVVSPYKLTWLEIEND